MFPLFLKLAGKVAVVVGHGDIGRRKIQALLSAGAEIRVVCLEKSDRDSHPHITWIIEPYSAKHLEGASLVFAAANVELNRKIVADAKARGIWVNSADDSHAGDFFLPATLQYGALQIAVSTGGVAPALAGRIRDRLAPQFDRAFADWLALLAEFRPIILAAIADSSRRHDLFLQLADWHWLDQIRAAGVESVRVALQCMVNEAAAR